MAKYTKKKHSIVYRLITAPIKIGLAPITVPAKIVVKALPHVAIISYTFGQSMSDKKK